MCQSALLLLWWCSASTGPNPVPRIPLRLTRDGCLLVILPFQKGVASSESLAEESHASANAKFSNFSVNSSWWGCLARSCWGSSGDAVPVLVSLIFRAHSASHSHRLFSTFYSSDLLEGMQGSLLQGWSHALSRWPEVCQDNEEES